MKKLFCILLSLIMVLSLAACGKEAPADEKETDKNKDETSSSATEPAADSDTDTDIDILPGIDNFNKVKTIRSGTAFADGVALVCTGFNQETMKDQYAVIDTKGKILAEFETDLWQYGLTYMGALKNGVWVDEYGICSKEGKLVATPETTGYTKLLTDARVDGKILAVKIDDKTATFGVLDTKGEWIEPLSETHPLSVYFKENRYDVNGLFFNNFVSDEVFWVAEGCYYNLKTGQITKYFNNYEDRGEDAEDGSRTSNIYLINDADEETCVARGLCIEYRAVKGFLGYYYTDADKPDAYYFFDYQGKEIIKFDASYVYDLVEADGYIIARCRDHADNFFTCIYTENGEKVTEPMNVNWSLADVRIYPEYEMFSIQENYFSFKGEQIAFDGYTVGEFGEGLFYAMDSSSNNCYIDLNGKKVIG